ncbi:hypothetical protein VN93_0163 [Lactococcus cremoris]|uniref:Transposase n=1 Tax=Lactococcus lactis subsp. cremoris TaxID=1359 RepID=A0ABR5EJW7_LACLC|nr:hypothetical protein VN93_0163 [Lactococcus cremoris]
MTYNSTLPKVFVYLLTTIETLYQTSVPLEVQNRKNVHLATSDCLVIACYLWGVLHFSETLKAKHQLAQSLFLNFLEYSRFVRRCNALLPSIQVIRQALVFKEVEGISKEKFDELVNFYTEDAVLVIKPGMLANGREQIKSAFIKIASYFDNSIKPLEGKMVLSSCW